MIKSITLINGTSKVALNTVEINPYQIEIEGVLPLNHSATLEIEFEIPISQFRNHDYKWCDSSQSLNANWYSPKILRLENQQLVQANQYIGIWEVNKHKRNVLLWHFNPKNSSPLAQYDANYLKIVAQAVQTFHSTKPLALLFPEDYAMEVSRSKVPFSAIACFTDHCDFDSLSNLKQQRQFFKNFQIKITKGFFLEHHSKRRDTASFELHKEEYKAWEEDGHELAYHSLTQSLKKHQQGIIDFENFEPAPKGVVTWIDHGFQPYNVSLYNNQSQLKANYGILLKRKNIEILWNYIDSGTATFGVINQINPNQFTLASYRKGIQYLSFKQRMPLLIKNIIFHYFDDAHRFTLYREVASYVKNLRRIKPFKTHIEKLISVFILFSRLSPVLLLWPVKKHQVYPLAYYAPTLFKHKISDQAFVVFQTIEMIDFKSGLSKYNIDLLMEQSGLFIAHTYFSAPLNYHQGKLFQHSNAIDEQVRANFAYLSEKIKLKELWNPTLSDLVEYFNKLSKVTFSCNADGTVMIDAMTGLHNRKVG